MSATSRPWTQPSSSRFRPTHPVSTSPSRCTPSTPPAFHHRSRVEDSRPRDGGRDREHHAAYNQSLNLMSVAPNIVVVMADQHRADMMGCAGDAGVLTPNLDRLAPKGCASRG